MLDEGAVASKARSDRLAGLGMRTDLARQRQERQRQFERHFRRLLAARQAAALGLLAFLFRRQLNIGPETAVMQADIAPGFGIDAQHLGFQRRLGAIAGAVRELARMAALGIVLAADESAVAADLEAEAALVAGRAGSGILLALDRREHVGAEQIVERIEHLGHAQIRDVLDGGGEIAPEVAQDLLPVQLAGGNAIELCLQIGREVVLHIAVEEAFQERGHEPALVLRHQPLLVEADIFAVAQNGQRRGVGRGPADAELFHLLDQGRLGVARRRFGEVLNRRDLLKRGLFAFGQRRQAFASSLSPASSSSSW